MKRKLLVLNLALIGLITAAGWRLRDQWRQGNAREQHVAGLRQALAAVPAPAAAQPPRTVTAASYSEIAQQMLFAQDRNPNVVVDATPPKPLPPLPVAHGLVNFGDGPMVILSEKEGAPHRGFSPGEKVGEFLLVSLNGEEIELEFEGQRVKKKFSELRSTGAAPAEPPVAAVAARPEPVAEPAQTVIAAKPVPAVGPMGPGREHPGSNTRACQPGDTSPNGTVMNGMRKFLKKTPFGELCRWEPLE